MRFMIATPALRDAYREARSTSRGRALELAAPPLIAVALIALAMAVSTAKPPAWMSELVDHLQAPATRPVVPELPAEWRERRPVVSFDHMYMSGQSPNRLDWIRESSGTSR